jgi:hypothetical protein
MPSTKPDLPVIRTLGGCGGTLVSRLFGALKRVVVLSETNPRSANLFGGHLNPLKQLRKWHPLLLENVIDFDEAEIGYPPRFGEMLEGIWTAAKLYDYRLVLRDFSYADFIGVPFIWPFAADSSLDAALEGRFNARSLYLLRHPGDQLASLRTHTAIAHVLTAERFVAGCSAFLNARGNAPLFRYESLVETPEATFRAMCEALDVPFAREAITEFASVTAVTGSLARTSETRITPGEPSPGSVQARRELALVPEYAALLTSLGYAA